MRNSPAQPANPVPGDLRGKSKVVAIAAGVLTLAVVGAVTMFLVRSGGSAGPSVRGGGPVSVTSSAAALKLVDPFTTRPIFGENSKVPLCPAASSVLVSLEENLIRDSRRGDSDAYGHDLRSTYTTLNDMSEQGHPMVEDAVLMVKSDLDSIFLASGAGSQPAFTKAVTALHTDMSDLVNHCGGYNVSMPSVGPLETNLTTEGRGQTRDAEGR